MKKRPGYLTITETAARLDCSRVLVYSLIDRGELPSYEDPAYKRGGKLIPEAAVDAYEAKRRAAVPPVG